MLGEVPEGKLVGLVSVLGSGNSHVAILARAMGIPTVMGLVDLPVLEGRRHPDDRQQLHGEVYTGNSSRVGAVIALY